jgi:EAL domain-containing protein (putative c-di-GMP-specific phosphodiesterase class I)
MEDPKRRSMLERLHAMRFRLSIDDFGTGYSSLSYSNACRCRAQDRQVVRDEHGGRPDDAAIVRSTIDLAHNMA